MTFTQFAQLVNAKFQAMTKQQLFVVDLDKHQIYDFYQNAFPEGTNPIYKERREHDCQTCKSFIRNIGNLIAINSDGSLTSVWDVPAENEYKVVAEAMSTLVKSAPIVNLFLKQEHKYGIKSNLAVDTGITWNHFWADVPAQFYNKFPDTILGEARTSVQLLQRGCEELSNDAFDTVLELIDQNSIYRGTEFRKAVSDFRDLQRKYQQATNKNSFLWQNYKNSAARFRNTAIGTLLIDLSEGMELDKAVASFESKVAPQNYKRTTALITQGMIDQAMKTIHELDIEPSLQRRYATIEDITINNVLWADRSVQGTMKNGIESLLQSSAKPKPVSAKVEEIHIDEFLSKVLPQVTSMEVLVENRLSSNLVSLIAPAVANSKNILKWNNNFSWAYAGGFTDSIKQNVKNAGGNVDGDFRISLSWINDDDLDLHCYAPDGHIYFSNKRPHNCKGQLDVDMMRGGSPDKPSVENIFWVREADMRQGNYKIHVHQYSRNISSDQSFEVQIEFKGQIWQFSSSNNSTKEICEISYDGKKVTVNQLDKSLSTHILSKDIWNVSTEQWQKISTVMLSPNFWDDQQIGNKHFFFMLDNCKNPDNIVGLYNEFLSNELTPHRKVFEVLGSKLKCQYTDNQLSGLGFSSTKRDSMIVKVEGAFTRQLKITF